LIFTFTSAWAVKIVTIANDLKLIDAHEPDSNAWFLVKARDLKQRIAYILVNGEATGYYAATKNNRVHNAAPNLKLALLDKIVVKAAIEQFIKHITE